MGRLIAVVGALLIYGAFDRPSRPPILMIALLGKLAFIGLVVSHGGRYLSQQTGLAVVIDSVIVLLFVGYLVGVRRQAEQPDAADEVSDGGRRGPRR